MINDENTRKVVQEILDKSNYLRSLLILIRKDKNVWDHEANLFLQESASLGYEKEFCMNALRELIGNKHIDNSPPVFFNKNYAVRFILRGIFMINQNVKIHPNQISYLVNTAYLNGLSEKWIKKIMAKAVKY
jgi:hypothetical protein